MVEQQEETRAEFHARRAKGIGGSDVAALLGLSRWKTPETLWLEKTGQVVTPPDDTPTPDMQRGIVFEPVVKDLYADKSGSHILPGKRGQHPDYPWMLYSLDGIEITTAGEERVLEVKCPSLGSFSRIKREGFPDDWRMQIQHYLCCTGYSEAKLVIFCADRMELMEVDVEADPLLHEMLIAKEREFWTLVETGTPPEPVVTEMREGTLQLVGKVEKRSDDESIAAFSQLRDAKALVRQAAEFSEQAQKQVLEVLDSRLGVFEVPGVGRVNHQHRTGRTSLDAVALSNAKPLDRHSVMAALNVVFEDGTLQDYWPRSSRWILQEIEKIVEGTDLDLADFEKEGKSYDELRFYQSNKE